MAQKLVKLLCVCVCVSVANAKNFTKITFY